MYWQVYLHKTVLSAEQMLQRIIKRAKLIGAGCQQPLQSFINGPLQDITLEQFCSIDDTDVLMAIKSWRYHPDKVLALLCNGIIDRKLFKVRYFPYPVAETDIEQKRNDVMNSLGITAEDAVWLVFTGVAVSRTYNFENERIYILFKDGTVKDISEVDNALINENLRPEVKKHYFCYIRF